jgi:ferric-dicitrate binding protein FerR (iron transport regulator)
VTFEHERMERFRRSPDTDQRLRSSEHPGRRHRRARPWIALAIGALVVVAFVWVLASDDGGGADEPFGAPAAAAVG